MENRTFNYKDDRFSIRPQAPPGGETHFNISDSGYGDRDIYHPHKRNNHPSNDINPPPNFVKKEEIIENTPNGAAPVTGNRPSIRLRAPPGGKSSLDYYSSEDNYKPTPLTKNDTVYDEPESKTSLSESEPKNESTTESSRTNSSSSFFSSNNDQAKYRPVFTPQAPPGGKSSISFGDYDEPETKPRPKPRPNPEFQESSINTQPAPTTGRRMNINNKQNNQSTFNSSIFSTEEENKPYKPYYAPQAPPGGKDSISLGSSTTTEKPKQNNQTTNNIFNSEDDKPYKPYYAPQAPPGGKDSISFGSSEPANTITSFSGRRRNYKNDHFKSSFSLY